jgi:hypothetical protein
MKRTMLRTCSFPDWRCTLVRVRAISRHPDGALQLCLVSNEKCYVIDHCGRLGSDRITAEDCGTHQARGNSTGHGDDRSRGARWHKLSGAAWMQTASNRNTSNRVRDSMALITAFPAWVFAICSPVSPICSRKLSNRELFERPVVGHQAQYEQCQREDKTSVCNPKLRDFRHCKGFSMKRDTFLKMLCALLIHYQ